MAVKGSVQAFYRKALLPILRSVATPLFRLTVGFAVKAGLLARTAPSNGDGREHFMIVHLSNHVGDTVMLLPMIESLRANHPGALIECVVQTPMAAFLGLVPSLDRVYEFDMDHGPTTTPWLELKRTLRILKSFWKSLRDVRPTNCIIPRWGCGFRDLMLAYLLQAPNRIGFASNDFDQTQPPAGYRDALLTFRAQGAQRMAEPARFRYLLEQAGLIPASDPRDIDARPSASMLHIASTVPWSELADRLGIEATSRLAVIAPGASAPRRMWPTNRWAEVVGDLHDRGFSVALLSGRGDADVAQRLYEAVPLSRQSQTVLVAGTTNLSESTCLIAHSEVLIGNDSGPGHIAGALGVPCVILFIAAEGADPDGPSAPERVRPMGQRVVCCRPARTVAPCSGYCTADCAHCILQISSGDVQRGVTSLLSANLREFRPPEEKV